ncbi:MAG: hypothetical protein ACTSWY_03625 [Promethearchaeota archaeon]
MGRTKQNYRRVVLNLPPKTAASLEYFVKISQFARTKSDLVVLMLNEFIKTNREILNDSESWQEFRKSFDKKGFNKLNNIIQKYSNEDKESEDNIVVDK